MTAFLFSLRSSTSYCLLFVITIFLLAHPGNSVQLQSQYPSTLEYYLRYLSSEKDNPPMPSWTWELAFDLSVEAFHFFQTNSNYSILESEDSEKCFNVAADSLKDNRSLLFEIINNSGKSLSDLGLEEECLKNNLTYFLLIYDVNMTKFLDSFNNTENYYVYKFLNPTSFFQGLCIWKECATTIKQFFTPSINEKFFTYLNSERGITKLDFVRAHDEFHPSGPIPYPDSTILLVIFIILFSFIGIKVTISIVGFCYYSSIERANEIKKMEADMSYDEGDSQEESSLERPTPLFGNNYEKTIETSPLEDRKPYKKYWWYKVYKFFSMAKDLRTLTTKKNKYYNDKGIELLSFFRVFILFWQTYNHNMYALIKIPIRDMTNISFYTSVWLSMVKYSIFAIECWVALDAMIMTYKLMSFLKSHLDEKYSFKTFLMFYIKIIPRIVILLFIFFMLNIYVEYYGSILPAGSMYDYFIEKINCRDCKTKPWILFIPFYIQYHNFQVKERGFSICFKYINICLNEFYCFTFVLLLFYLIYRFKSKVLDSFVLIALFVNFSLSFLSYDSFIGKNYSLLMFLGESNTLKYTHILLNTYMFGVFAGMIAFYFTDVISTNPIASSDEYKPFYFCYALMKYLDKKTSTVKKVFLCLCVLMQVLLSMTFYFYMRLFNESSDDRINVKINGIMEFLDMYEKQLFVLVFILMIIIILLYPKDTTLRHFYDSHLFIPISRVSFAYFCSTDTLIYIFYCVFHFQLHLNFQNIFFMTLGLMTLVSISSLLLVSIIELPFRVTLRKMLGTTNDSRKIIQ